MSKLVLEMGQYHNLVFGRVVHQDEELRAKDGNNHVLAETADGFKVCSFNYPTAREAALFVCGQHREFDDDVMYCTFGSTAGAEQYLLRLGRAVRALNDSEEASRSGCRVELEVVK